MSSETTGAGSHGRAHMRSADGQNPIGPLDRWSQFARGGCVPECWAAMAPQRSSPVGCRCERVRRPGLVGTPERSRTGVGNDLARGGHARAMLDDRHRHPVPTQLIARVEALRAQRGRPAARSSNSSGSASSVSRHAPTERPRSPTAARRGRPPPHPGLPNPALPQAALGQQDRDPVSSAQTLQVLSSGPVSDQGRHLVCGMHWAQRARQRWTRTRAVRVRGRFRECPASQASGLRTGASGGWR